MDTLSPVHSPERLADFGDDTAARSTSQAVRDYLSRLRAGELGSIPALLGLAVLVTVFASVSDVFLSLANLANLLSQSAGTMIISMGLVFVLITAEIDVSAGTASGLTAAVLALHYTSDGNLLTGMGTTVFYTFIVVLCVAIAAAVAMRLWAAAVLSAVPIFLMLAGFTGNPWIEMLLAVTVGGAIGTLTGFLVAKVRIPSFVITLALFLTWQGVILKLIGTGGVLGIRTSPILDNVANGNLDVWQSWLLYALVTAGYSTVTIGRHLARTRRGNHTQPMPLILLKIAAVVVLGALATWLLTLNRSTNPGHHLSGVPYVVPVVLVLLVAGTYVLSRTKYGLHIYAVGGNAEAARRAGVNVDRIKGSVFVVSSCFAAIGAIVYSSKVGSVDPSAGGLNTLLFAVGAAVIGGTSLFGGRGRLSNAVLGGLVLAVVENGLGLVDQPAAIVSIVTGLVLALAAAVDALSRRRAQAF
ncbi:ABC transporter permease [Streptomyces sp. NPDC050625]|uniref:sugar ABC transporter permease n=1 Tax=Streptomyces sp. NPDC050625 TaxID=3154629 RepID=UPI0034315C40